LLIAKQLVLGLVSCMRILLWWEVQYYWHDHSQLHSYLSKPLSVIFL